MSRHLYEEIDELHRVIERLNSARESLEAEFDQMVMECFEVVSTTDVDQNGNHIERSVPKHYMLAADVARLEAENERLRTALEFYANPDVYKPHPHGPAFDRRDLSYHAISALEATP